MHRFCFICKSSDFERIILKIHIFLFKRSTISQKECIALFPKLDLMKTDRISFQLVFTSVGAVGELMTW